MEMQQVNNQNSCSQIQKSSEKMRILVVDDNATCLTIVAAILRKLSHQVVTAKHPADALCALRTMEFDLVVVDVHMPDINGFELQQLIHSEFQLPVILMSADDRAVNIWKENHKQVAHFILKPVSIEDMKFLVKYAEEYWMNKNQAVKRIMYNKSSCDGDNDDGKNALKKGTSSGTNKHKKVWTEELHSKFVEAVQFLGPERAIPRNIVKMMNEPGLTRENVASHLQKYRIQLMKQSEATSSVPGTDRNHALSMPSTLSNQKTYGHMNPNAYPGIPTDRMMSSTNALQPPYFPTSGQILNGLHSVETSGQIQQPNCYTSGGTQLYNLQPSIDQQMNSNEVIHPSSGNDTSLDDLKAWLNQNPIEETGDDLFASLFPFEPFGNGNGNGYGGPNEF